MAYIARRIGGSTGATSTSVSFTFTIPEHEVGDLLLLFFTATGSGEISATSATTEGWTLGNVLTTDGSRANYMWKVATGIEKSPTINKSSTGRVVSYSAFVIKDFDEVNTIRSSYASTAVARTNLAWAALPALTSQQDDLVFHFAVKVGNTNISAPRPFATNGMYTDIFADKSGTSINQSASSSVHAVFAETSPSTNGHISPAIVDLQDTAAAGGLQVSIGVVIANKTGGKVGPRFYGDFDFCFTPYGTQVPTGHPEGYARLSSVVIVPPSSMFGKPCVFSANTTDSQTNNNPDGCHLPIAPMSIRFSSSTGVENWVYRSFEPRATSSSALVPINLDSGEIMISYARVDDSGINFNTSQTDYFISLVDSTGKMATYRFSEELSGGVFGYTKSAYNGRQMLPHEPKSFVMQKGAETIADSGFNWADVVRFDVAMLMNEPTTVLAVMSISAAFKGSSFGITGGSTGRALNKDDIHNIMGKRHVNASILSSDNLTIRAGLDIGDGINKTVMDLKGNLVVFCSDNRTKNSTLGKTRQITFNTSASDELYLNDLSIKRAVKAGLESERGKVVFASTCLTPSVLAMNGMSISGCSLSVDSSNINISNMSMNGAFEATGTGGSFSNVAFVKGYGVYDLALTAPSYVTGCSFFKGATTEAIRITAAGDYHLEESVFVGYGTDVHVTATSGIVRIYRQEGDTDISIVSDGATVELMVTEAPGSITGTCLPGSRVHILNLTDNSVVMNSVLADGSILYEGAVNNSGGIVPLRVRITREGYLPFETTAKYRPNIGVDLNIEQREDSVYNSIAIPFGSVLPISKVGNSFVLSSDSVSIQQIYAFARHSALSETGIVSSFNDAQAEDTTNFYLNGVKIKASIAGTSVYGGYVRMSDGSAPFDITGETVFLDYGRAYVASSSNAWDEVIESGMSAREIMRLHTAVLVGGATGLESGTPEFKSLDGTKTRVSSTYSSGTRTIEDTDAS